jgi:hypothetical protein
MILSTTADDLSIDVVTEWCFSYSSKFDCGRNRAVNGEPFDATLRMESYIFFKTVASSLSYVSYVNSQCFGEEVETWILFQDHLPAKHDLYDSMGYGTNTGTVAGSKE